MSVLIYDTSGETESGRKPRVTWIGPIALRSAPIFEGGTGLSGG
jgi:hypothetical protein